jgi:hypothetical protein
LPSGWTRFERKTTNVSLAGSIQSEVPVKPVWPNEPAGKRSPRLVEKDVCKSQPRPRAPPSSVTCRGRVISATPSGERTRAPSYSPPFRIIWQKTARSSAVEKSPAWPATPPMRLAVGSCTCPRSIVSEAEPASPAPPR